MTNRVPHRHHPDQSWLWQVESLAVIIQAVAEKLTPGETARMVVHDHMLEGQSVVECVGPEDDTNWQAVANAILVAAWPNRPRCGGSVTLHEDGAIDLVLEFPEGSNEYSPVCWSRPIPDDIHDEVIEAFDCTKAGAAEIIVTDRPPGGQPYTNGDMNVHVTLHGRPGLKDDNFTGWPSRPEPGSGGFGVPMDAVPPDSIAALTDDLLLATGDPWAGHPELRTRILVRRTGAPTGSLVVALNNPAGGTPSLSWSRPAPGGSIPVGSESDGEATGP